MGGGDEEEKLVGNVGVNTQTHFSSFPSIPPFICASTSLPYIPPILLYPLLFPSICPSVGSDRPQEIIPAGLVRLIRVEVLMNG